MLQDLSVKNIGTLGEATLSFGPGLNVLLGESGSGKSLLLGGLRLALGGRFSEGLLSPGKTTATVETTWALNPTLEETFKNAGYDLDQGKFYLHRDMGEKSRYLVQGCLSPTGALQNLTPYLLQLHGQSDQLKLRDKGEQLRLLDSFGKLDLAPYSRVYGEFRSAQALLKRAIEEAGVLGLERLHRQEFIKKFQEVDPQENELELTEAAIRKLSHLEEMATSLGKINGYLEPEEMESPLGTLRNALRELEKITSFDPELETLQERLETQLSALEESFQELQTYGDTIDLGELQRLQVLTERFYELKSFLKPFGGDLTQAFAAFQEAQRQEELFEAQDTEALQKRVETLQEQALREAQKLREARLVALMELQEKVNLELQDLAMGDLEFLVELEEGDLGPRGHDQVSFMAVSHGGSPRPLSKAVSGGELSRFMLALELVTSPGSGLTLIFDEVDSGVGGTTALAVGRSLSKLSKRHQVIVISHLPQVAAWGDSFHLVTKDQGTSTVTSLSLGEVPSVLATMMTGLESSQSAQDHAQELFDLAQGEKQLF